MFYFIHIILFIFSYTLHANDAVSISKPYYWKITPPAINGSHMAIETGFITQKKYEKFNYDYNAFVGAFLARETYIANHQLKTAELGFKGGLLFPVVPIIPIFLQGNAGYAKTAFQEDPIFGKSKQTISKKDMFFYELGSLYHFERFFLNALYQKNNLNTVEQSYFLSIGGTFK